LLNFRSLSQRRRREELEWRRRERRRRRGLEMKRSDQERRKRGGIGVLIKMRAGNSIILRKRHLKKCHDDTFHNGVYYDSIFYVQHI
jgi:hypothetical protein